MHTQTYVYINIIVYKDPDKILLRSQTQIVDIKWIKE